MLAADGGLGIQLYIHDDWLSLDDCNGHLRRLQKNPNAGAAIIAIAKSFGDGKEDKKRKPRAQRTQEEQKQFEQEQLQGLMSHFGNCGPKPKRKLVDYVC